MIKALFFDAAGTLVHLIRTVGENYAAVARQFGSELDPEALDRAFIHAWKRAPIRAAIDHPRAGDDKNWWRELVADVLNEVPDVPATFDRAAFFEAAYRHFAKPGVWALYSDVEPTLRELHPHFRLFVISNFDRRLHPILADLGVADCFEEIFLSSELGADKPDPEIFRRALGLSGCTGEEGCHVGDDPERDWRGAAAAGLHIFRLDRGKNSLRDLPAALREGALALRAQAK